MVHKSKKKSHKSASSKKSKKERDHKKKRSHGDRATDNDDGCPLGDALTQALLTCPKLLEELPQMALALDKGEFINLEGISNVPMRESLIQVFNNIPIVSKDNTGQGWYRNTKDKRITSYIMNSLTGCKVIRDPRKLDSSQSTTSRIPAIHLLSLVQQFPNIVSELPVIIDQILEGNAVALENIADEDLGEALEKLLKSLGLVQTRDGLDIPSGREGDHVVDCLEHFEEIFKAYERGNYRLSSSNEGKTRYDSDSDRSSSSSESQHSYCSSSSSSSSRNKASHEIIEDDESGDEIGPSIKVAGPSMPTKRELEKAQLLMENYQKTHGISSDEEDDEFGPKLRTDGHVDVSNNSMPLGYLGIEMPKATVDSRVIDQLIPVVEKREEWLLTPGESKSLADLMSDPTKITARKFQMGKQAKKKAEELQIRNAYLKSIEGNGQAAQQTIVDNRPSLMEEHLSKKARVEEPGSRVRRAFDREKDVVGQKKLGMQEVQQLVENSKDLSSRFSSGAVQKNFM